MENNIRRRIIYKNKNNQSMKKNIILPLTLNDLIDECNKIFKLNNEYDLTFIAKFFEKSDVKITNSNYEKILKSDDTFYEIKMKKNKKKIIKNENDYLLAKKENEDNIHIDRNNNEFLFKFTLINKGNFDWKKPFKISNKKILKDDPDKNKLLVCTTQVIYKDVSPNEEIECEVNILELKNKNKNSVLKIQIFKSDNSYGKYPENCVEYNFIID